MKSEFRRGLVSLGTSIAGGVLTVTLIGHGVEAIENSRQFKQLQEDANAINVAAQNLLNMTKLCGADTKPAEKVVKDTAALAGFDVDFRWVSSDKVTLTISRDLDRPAEDRSNVGAGSFTYTDEIEISSDQRVADQKEQTPDFNMTLDRMCRNLK